MYWKKTFLKQYLLSYMWYILMYSISLKIMLVELSLLINGWRPPVWKAVLCGWERGFCLPSWWRLWNCATYPDLGGIWVRMWGKWSLFLSRLTGWCLRPTDRTVGRKARKWLGLTICYFIFFIQVSSCLSCLASIVKCSNITTTVNQNDIWTFLLWPQATKP